MHSEVPCNPKKEFPRRAQLLWTHCAVGAGGLANRTAQSPRSEGLRHDMGQVNAHRPLPESPRLPKFPACNDASRNGEGTASSTQIRPET